MVLLLLEINSIKERLDQWSIPEPNSGCVLWLGAARPNGYCQMKINGRMHYVHRVSYELTKGPILKGLTLDHLCRVRSCLNPNHLEPVSSKENTLRGHSIMVTRAAQTHCINGHPFTGEHLYIPPDGGRSCRTCKRLRMRAYRMLRNRHIS